MSGKRSGTPESTLRVLYDGGPLIFSPGGPAALHVLELLEALPGSVEPWLALPGKVEDLPACDHLRVLIEPARDWLAWEQISLPALIRRVKTGLVHLTTLRAPFFSSAPCVISPAEPLEPSINTDFRSRLSESLGRGGFSRARAVFWPDDLPDPPWNISGIHIPLVRLPPFVHSAFYRPQPTPADLPDMFVFCPGPLREADLETMISVWRRAGAALGEDYALLIEGMPPERRNGLKLIFEQAGIASPLHAITLPDPGARAALVQQAAEVLCIRPVLPWADPLLQALACERPLAAIETPYSDARVGPAGYLAPPGDARALAAAVLTPLVEEPVQEQLIAAAHLRAAAWNSDQFSAKLDEAYWQIYRRAKAT